MDEPNLILRLRSGDRRALEEIIQGYTHYLTAVAARALGPAPSREDLEEVVSDAFLALWRSRDKIEPERSLRPFLAVTARNLAYSKLRSRRETEEIPDHLPDSRPGPEELAERQALHRHLRQLVEEKLSALPRSRQEPSPVVGEEPDSDISQMLENLELFQS